MFRFALTPGAGDRLVLVASRRHVAGSTLPQTLAVYQDGWLKPTVALDDFLLLVFVGFVFVSDGFCYYYYYYFVLFVRISEVSSIYFLFAAAICYIVRLIFDY